MAHYSDDRAFTDHIHNNVAIPRIYNPIDWTQLILDAAEAERLDVHRGIDYIFEHDGEIKTVQERFRESTYQQYSDFTIRYRRDNNVHSERHESEYYKMKAEYITYGITNCLKNNTSKCTDFIKYAIVDLNKVYEHIDNELIIIRDNGRRTCRIINDKIIECPIIPNKDGSSSFFPIEISFLVKLWGDDMIIAQKGFI